MDTLWFYRAYCVDIVSPMLWGWISFLSYEFCVFYPRALAIYRKYFFLREQKNFGQKIYFVQRVKPVEHGWQKKLFSLISFWQWTSNCYKMWQLSINYVHSITTYMQLWFCVPLSIIDAWHCHLLCAAMSRLLERWVCEVPHYFFHGIQKRL